MPNDYLISVLEKSRKKLLDTSRRNRLLNFKETARDVAIVDEMPDNVFKHLVIDSKYFKFKSYDADDLFEEEQNLETNDISEDDHKPDRTLPTTRETEEKRWIDDVLQTPHTERELERKLRTLFYDHRRNIEETGANNLYLIAGFLDWSDEKGEREEKIISRAPLILIPVRINREKVFGATEYKLQFDDSALDTNFSLSEKLANNFDINLPLISEEKLPEQYWKEIEDAIQSKKRDGWKVIREMTLGLFRFNKQIMWHDLDPSKWPEHSPLLDKKVIKRILEGAEDDTPPGILTEEYNQEENEQENQVEKLTLVGEADSSQYSALIDAMNERDGLVIEGPPGTGKSQTITNLIAIALEKGLSVLFVAEKLAALSVVYDRLNTIGLGDFCMRLHGLKPRKKDLLTELDKRINLQTKSPRELEQKENELKATKDKLIEFSKAISKIAGPEEIPLYDIPWRTEKLKQDLPDAYEGVTIDKTDDITYESFANYKELMEDLGREWDEISIEARSAWYGFVPNNYNEARSEEFKSQLNNAISSCNKLQKLLDGFNINEDTPSLNEISRLLEFSQLDVEQNMPHLPSGIRTGFAHQIIHGGFINDYSELLIKIEDYLNSIAEVNSIFDYANEDSSKYYRLLKEHTESIGGVCCDSATLITDLSKEKVNLDNVIEGLGNIHEYTQPITKYLSNLLRTIDDYRDIISEADNTLNGPSELSLHAHDFHVKATVNNFLKEARKEYDELTQLENDLPVFNFESSFEASDVNESYIIINEKRDSWFPILNSDYRRSRKYIRGILNDSKLYSREGDFIGQLKKLVDYCKKRDSFHDNEDYKKSLGSLFDGIKTKWEVLEKIINFSQKLRESVGSENAENIISNWDSHIESIKSSKEKISSTISLFSNYRDSHPFPAALWQRPVTEILSTLTPWSEKLSQAITNLNRSWCNHNVSLADSKRILEIYKQAKEKETSIEEHEAFDKLIKEFWQKSQTDLSTLKELDSWFRDRLSISCINEDLLKFVIPDEETFQSELFSELLIGAKEFKTKFPEHTEFLNGEGDFDSENWIGGKKVPLADFRKKLETTITTIHYLPLMSAWQKLAVKVSERNLSSITKNLTEGILNGEQAPIAFEYSFYNSLLKNEIGKSSTLKNFSPGIYDNLRNKFSGIDKDILRLNSAKIASALGRASIPLGVHTGRVGEYTDKSLIRHYANQKQPRIQVRQLVKRASNAIKSMKPCFMMSPISVAQYLAPGEISFDLVVMDESSQIRPEDALGAIARAEKCIIVGDPKQLPPPPFFETTHPDDEDVDETILDDTESILDVCLKQFPYRRLRWHYRSQHESLIQFSNKKFYDDDLIIFPSPKGDARDFGVHHTFIDNPSYKSGRNRNEAEIVAENIIYHLKHHNDRSLGVAAFNKRQAEELQLIFDKKKEKEPEVEEAESQYDKKNPAEPLFIKNLENVQGDERDVIFISTTYGPESSNANVFQRFGPINSDMGWRRLNVIATRAKQKVELFTSMKPTDINIGPQSRQGVRALRDYIEYVSTGRIKEYGTPTDRAPDSDFEIAVIKIINDLGYECDPQVGVAGFFIDIGVRHPDRPGEYLLGVECDGATYHSSKSVRDRDRLRQEILEDKGWYIHRIWSTSWFNQRSVEVERLQKILNSEIEKDRIAITQVSTEAAEEIIKVEPSTTSDDIKKEKDDADDLLRLQLNRFWEKNISPHFKNRENSILSETMIDLFIGKRPLSEEDWFNFIPQKNREIIEPNESEYLEDILEILMEYC